MILSTALSIWTSLIYHFLYRRRSRSISPRHRRRRSRSPTLRRRRSRSSTPSRHKRQKSRSASLSPIAKVSSIGPIEGKIVVEKLKKEDEDEKKRYFSHENPCFIIVSLYFFSVNLWSLVSSLDYCCCLYSSHVRICTLSSYSPLYA